MSCSVTVVASHNHGGNIYTMETGNIINQGLIYCFVNSLLMKVMEKILGRLNVKVSAAVTL